MAGIILAVFGAPIVLGLSWFPMPHNPFSPIQEDYSGRTPAYPVGVDDFSFPHFDWPARIVAKEAHLAGELPLWNPHAGLGVPLVGQYEPQILFPLEILERFLGLEGWQFMVLLRAVLAGTGAYLLLTSVAAAPASRLAGALFYALSACFVWFVSIPAFVSGAMLVPWLFWAAWSLALTKFSALRAAALAGVVLGFMLLTGQPQITALAILACALFVVLLHLFHRPNFSGAWLRLVFLSAVTLLLAVAISAPQIFYFLEIDHWGYSLHSPGAFEDGRISPLTFTVPLWPHLLGQPMKPWYRELFPDQLNWEAFPMLLGASGLLLGLLGVVMLISNTASSEDRKPPAAIAMLLLSTVILAVPLSAAVGFPIWRIQWLDRINFPRYIVPVLSLGIATLVAFTLDRIASVRRGDVAWTVASAVLVITACYALVHPIVSEPDRAVSALYYWHSVILGWMPFLSVAVSLIMALHMATRSDADPAKVRLVLLVIVLAEHCYFVRYGFDTQHELWRLPVTIGTCIAALCLTRFPRQSWTALGALALAPLVLVATAERSLPARIDPSARPSALGRALQMELGANSIHGRMISTQKSWIPNFGNAFGISQLESLAPIQLKGTADLIFNALADKKLNYTVPNAWPGISESGPYPSWQDYEARRVFYNLLAVRALVDTQGGWLSQRPMDGVVPVWSNEHHILYRDTHARARAYLVAAQEPKTAHGPELDRRPTMNVIQNIFELARKHDIVEGDVQVRKITPGLMQIDIRASKPALLVIADSYYPGWTALVDGRERRMARVAGALRGVFVRPEDRRVELRFRPKYLHALLWTSAAAFTVAVLLVISGGWHSRRFSLVSQRTRRRRSQPR